MLKGIHLTLMVGPAVPLPVPQEMIDALVSVSVTTSTDGPSVFQLQFSLSNRSPLQTLFMVAGGSSIPFMRVLLIITINGVSQTLCDGVMTNHEMQPGAGAGNSNLTITGDDLSRVMDYVDFSGIPYPAMPPELRVLAILAKYAPLGITPLVIPPILPDIPIPTSRIPIHQGTDLEYINQMASEVGHVFYIDPGPKPGMSVAYWGPRIKVGVPQPALNTNMDAHTNVQSINFSFNSQDASLPVIYIQDAISKAPIPIPIPDISPLNPPLGLIPPIPLKIDLKNGTAKLPPTRAASIGLTAASESSNVVTGSGTLDVLRYGRLLRPRGLVGVRGVGPAFDGLHYVESVTDKLERGKFTQSFNLSRNGLISTIPKVNS